MDYKMLAIMAAMVVPGLVEAREGPDCPADPYVRVYQQLEGNS